ncbi:MAG: shikimate kinase [Alphaproteobacteria bacterium]|nr:shikimate kinase [Alphaproteobacteria bacterium]
MSASKLGKKSIGRPIVLLGMMGAGKTSVGQALAGLLSVPFFDSDTEIEAAAGCSVSQIFADYGETEFRRLEKQVIARLLDGGPCVLSLGGGAFMTEETKARVKEKALSVWLKVDRKILLERVTRNDSRPLLRGSDQKEKLERLLTEREPVYAQADLTVSCDDRPVPENAQTLLAAIQAESKSQTEPPTTPRPAT